MALGIFDISYLNLFNNLGGHLLGDQVIEKVQSVLQILVCEVDLEPKIEEITFDFAIKLHQSCANLDKLLGNKEIQVYGGFCFIHEILSQSNQYSQHIHKDDTTEDKVSVMLLQSMRGADELLSSTEIYKKMFALADERMQYHKVSSRVYQLIKLMQPLVELIQTKEDINYLHNRLIDEIGEGSIIEAQTLTAQIQRLKVTLENLREALFDKRKEFKILYKFSTKCLGDIKKRDLFQLANISSEDDLKLEIARLLELKRKPLLNSELFEFSFSDGKIKSLENHDKITTNQSTYVYDEDSLTDTYDSSYTRASFQNKITFGYFSKKIQSIRNSLLNRYDIFEFKADAQLFSLCYFNQDHSKKPNFLLFNQLSRAFWRYFSIDFARTFLYAFIAEFLSLVSFLSIGSVLRNMKYQEISRLENFFYIMLIIMILLCLSAMKNQYQLQGQLIPLKFRKCLVDLLFEKVKRIKTEDAIKSNIQTQFISIVSHDMVFLERSMGFMIYILVGPLINLLALIYVYQQFGSTASTIFVIGFSVQIASQVIISKISFNLRFMESFLNDKRMRDIKEVLNNIIPIQTNNFQQFFEKKILKNRQDQSQYTFTINLILSIGNAFFQNTGIIVFLFTILTIKSQDILVSQVDLFALFATFGYLATSINSITFGGFMCYSQFKAVLVKIQKLLNIPERMEHKHNLQTSYQNTMVISTDDHEESKYIYQVVPKSSSQYELKSFREQNYNMKNKLQIDQKQKILIVGETASGKSQMIRQLVGDLSIDNNLDDCLSYPTIVSYAPQLGFTIVGTIEENILFGQPYSQQRLFEVLSICQISDEIFQMPNGFNTQIQENAKNLSGGQMQRISLARALYRDADVFLLDDPLSQVDQSVADQIMLQILQNQRLKDKCIVMTSQTNRYQDNFNQIINLSEKEEQEIVSNRTSVNSEDISIFDTQNESVKSVNLGKNFKQLRQSDQECKIHYKTFISMITYSYGKLGLLLFAVFAFLPNLTFLMLTYELSKIISSDFSLNDDVLKNFIGISITLIVFSVSRNFTNNFLLRQSSQKIHSDIIRYILYGNSNYLKKSQHQVIQTNLSKDLAIFDMQIPYLLTNISNGIIKTAIVFIAILYTFPSTLVILILGLISYLSFLMIIRVSKILNIYQENDNSARGNFNNQVNSVSRGLTLIRVMNAFDVLKHRLIEESNLSAHIGFSMAIAMRWISLRIDVCSNVLVSLCLIMPLIFNDHIQDSSLLMVIQLSIDLAFVMSITIKLAIEFINLSSSWERLMLLASDQNFSVEDKKVQLKQQVKFKNISVALPRSNKHILKDVTFKILKGQKVGIIGRTGSGKSTLALTLIGKIRHNHGQIVLDSQVLKRVKIDSAYLGQHPFIFKGTIRENLDPMNQKTEDEIILALKNSLIWDRIQSLPNQLDEEIDFNDQRLSPGQQQQLSLARIVLNSKSELIILDEIYSNIDEQCSHKIKKAIETIFEQNTVIQISHKIETVIDSDQIIVVSSGSIIENDHPFRLLSTQDNDSNITNCGSTFSKLVIKSGDVIKAQDLFERAKESYQKHLK
ncbi:multidrug resistance-associated protein 4 [Stylonychia lemnae]|uniref:Multidrug resistance-associated protein 4 n=1 Tax=Stylonychia lemnae TaxID=5949 RepID=A0A078A7Q5_STYLE|nr:multidrug resistance-associated protein 4 [Stylonychia lemnae]|eukprot:CDW77607.1 multidrug resistance-associated protein 4 [Stylonychia lemnae]